MDKTPVVYITASGRNGTLYTGVTSDLPGRIYQHRTKAFSGFSAKHGCNRLVWYEVHEEMEPAIIREKRIKEWKRAWKIALIEACNPIWRDLAEDLGFDPLP
ncbi:putative endonuclease [Sphingomonas kyeonggiensis]|uniref:GIY-YIG nuclease family protein n=1 Tax=Sphingomonas kyeonggiensis TaxID=1268553 RepID=UPI00278A018C|nr:GIY-YIG nuclease family protein [Sphingomonas kyeonggiensis]MDQ0251764.1 putative endonuclease [Sphingomonas kyeonggiensis]